jgi:hypothetical protein
VDVSVLLLARGDTFILATDGLTDLVSEDEIGALAAAHPDPEAVCRELVALANQRGGFDNITVQVLRILNLPPREEAKTRTLPDTPGPAIGAAKTLVDAGLPDAAAQPSQPEASHAPPHRRTTLSDGELASGARADAPRTMVDAHPERLTEPALRDEARAGGGAVTRAQASSARKVSWIVAISAIFVALVLGGVAVWWLLRVLQSKEDPDDAPPPPAFSTNASQGTVHRAAGVG